MKCPVYHITDKPTYTCIAKYIFKYSVETVMEFWIQKMQSLAYLRYSRGLEFNSYERMIYNHLEKFTGLQTGMLHWNLFSVSKSIHSLVVADYKKFVSKETTVMHEIWILIRSKCKMNLPVHPLLCTFVYKGLVMVMMLFTSNTLHNHLSKAAVTWKEMQDLLCYNCVCDYWVVKSVCIKVVNCLCSVWINNWLWDLRNIFAIII